MKKKESPAVQKGLETKAQKAEATGDLGKAADLRESAQTVQVAPKAVEVPIAPDVSTRKVWYAEVIDLKALCKAVAEGAAAPESVEPNMPFLNTVARQMKERGSNIPGVVFKQKESLLG